MVLFKWAGNKKLVQNLVNTLPYSAKPLYVNGKWRSPKLSGRQVVELKKAAAHHGISWPLPEKQILKTYIPTNRPQTETEYVSEKEVSPLSVNTSSSASSQQQKSAQTDHISYKKHGFIKQLRGRKADLPENRNKRIEEIADKLKGMSARMEKLREEERNRRWKDVMDFSDITKASKIPVKKSKAVKKAATNKKDDKKKKK